MSYRINYHAGIQISLILCCFCVTSACTSIITTKGDSPDDEKIETTALSGWNSPNNMRELGDLGVPDDAFNTAPSIRQSRTQARPEDSSGSQGENFQQIPEKIPHGNNEQFSQEYGQYNNCPPGTIPYFNTPEANNLMNTRIRAPGYGAKPKKYYSPQQQRLLAIRAAKLDAMRTLSERIYGVELWGGTTLSDLALKSDRVHVQIDAFLFGARTLSTLQLQDGSYEVMMELKFDKKVLASMDLHQCVKTGASLTARND